MIEWFYHTPHLLALIKRTMQKQPMLINLRPEVIVFPMVEPSMQEQEVILARKQHNQTGKTKM
jgi:hypothetical protein